jgi:hypothetical protein
VPKGFEKPDFKMFRPLQKFPPRKIFNFQIQDRPILILGSEVSAFSNNLKGCQKVAGVERSDTPGSRVKQ